MLGSEHVSCSRPTSRFAVLLPVRKQVFRISLSISLKSYKPIDRKIVGREDWKKVAIDEYKFAETVE
jgi:hypothetical protein